jgi:thiol-disulfide isomerase/thioredoxin
MYIQLSNHYSMRISCLLFLPFFALTAQSQTPPDAVAPEDPSFNTIYASRSIPIVTGKLLHLPTVQADGSFSLEIDYALPYQQIWLTAGDYFYAGVYANKDLYVELDIAKLKPVNGVQFNGDGVRYLGTDGPLNVYLNNYELYKRPEQLRINNELSQVRVIQSRNTDSLLPLYAKLWDSLRMIEDSYIASNPSPYSWILPNERLSEYYGQLCALFLGKTMDNALWEKIKGHQSYLVSNSSAELHRVMSWYVSSLPGRLGRASWKDLADLPDLDAAERNLMDSLREGEKMKPAAPYTPENMKRWTSRLAPRIQYITLLRNIQKIDSSFPSAKADFIKLGLSTSYALKEQELPERNILASMHTPWCMAVEKQEHTRLLRKIDEVNGALAQASGGKEHGSFGKPFLETDFGASMYDITGMKAADFLGKLQQSFPGVTILIDRWATWCGPCLAEMPHSKKLQEASKGMPVVFVYLCTLNSSSKDKWLSKVTELKQPGFHFLIDEKMDAEVSTYFSFHGYPGYAMIDKGGNYRPGAIEWRTIENKDALAALIK